MPPALVSDNDSDSSGTEHIPAQKTLSPAKTMPELVDVDNDDDDDDDDDASVAEDEYVVQEILAHKFAKNGELQFDVKWVGYEDPKDRTWEPESNMKGAIDIVDKYFDRLGGRPEPKAGTKRKGRQSTVKSDGADTPVSSNKRPKEEWKLPGGSWEHDVSHIDTVEEKVDPKTGEVVRHAYLVWNNQRKTQHPLKHIYQKCPQKMLHYYESHLVFTQNDGPSNDDEPMRDV